MTNRLVVFEGLDGTGKTTLSRSLNEELRKHGVPSVRFEDLENKSGGFNALKPFIKEKAVIDSSLFFYIASAIHKSEEIKSLLRKQWVICDRYVFSTLAYHQAQGADLSLLPELSRLPVMKPDFYFLLRTKEPIRIQRLKARADSTPDDFQPKTAGSFMERMECCLEQYDPIILDNSSMGITETLDHILKIVRINIINPISCGK